MFAPYSLPRRRLRVSLAALPAVPPRFLLPAAANASANLLVIDLMALLMRPGLAVCSAGVVGCGMIASAALLAKVDGVSFALTAGIGIAPGNVDGSIVPA